MKISQKPLLIIALESEEQGRLATLGFDIVYCGVGKINAGYRLMRALHANGMRYPYVLNLGSAGSHQLDAGQLVEIERFVQRDMDATGLGFALGETPFDPFPHHITVPRRFGHLRGGTCASGDSFLQTPSPIPCDVIDMEAYALAKVCLHEEIPFTSVKYITDGANGSASKDWHENLRYAADSFAELLQAA